MTKSIQALRKEEGFTLVELAVVMIIIGLLIGGVLKGQELIVNARVTSTISQMESFGAAYNGFLDQYNVQPGDMTNAANRLPGCANQCTVGNNNGTIDIGMGVATTLANEGSSFFAQLLAAGYITGMDGTNALGVGTSNPTAPIGGGFFVGDARVAQGIAATGFPAVRARPHIILTSTQAAVATTTGVLLPSQAGTLDRRLDDGNPQTGSVVGQNLTTDCVATAGDAFYDEATGNQTCVVAYRL